MSTRPPAGPDGWPRRHAELLQAYLRQADPESLRGAGELGGALAEARVPLADIATVQLAQLEDLMHAQTAAAADVLREVAPVCQHVMAAYGAAIEERAGRERVTPSGATGPVEDAGAGHSTRAGGYLAERRFREVLDHSGDLLVRIRLADLYVEYVGRACEDISGYSAAEVQAGGWAWIIKHVHVEDRNLFESTFKAAPALTVAAERGQAVEFRFLHRDGTFRWHNSRRTIVRDAAGRPVAVIASVRDVTARKQAEDALRREQQLLQLLMENLPDNIFFKDRDSRFTHVNQALVQFYRRTSAADVIGKWDGDFYARDMADGFRAEERRLFETGEPIIGKTEFATVDPAMPRWFSTTKVPVRDARGEVVGLVGVSREITAQRRAEQALHESEQRYRALAESAQDVIFIISRAGIVEYVNQFAAAQLRLRPEDVIGRPRASFFLPEEAARQGRELEQVFASGEPLVTAARVTFPGGERWIHTNLVALRQPSGEVTAVLGISRDITDRRRAEQALRREKDRAQQFLDIAGVMFVALDAHGVVTLVNKKACAVLECGEQDLIGKSWFDALVPEHDRDRAKLAFRQLAAGGIEAAEYHENAVLTNTGQERLIAWHNTVLRDEAGSIVGTLSSGEDITERRQAEEEIRRYQEHLEALVAQRTRELEKVNARLQEELAFSTHIVTGVPAIICRVAADGTTLFVNPAGERITGYRAEELIGRNWLRLLYPGDEYSQVERLFEAFQQGNVRDYEMVLTTKTGQKRTISWNSINQVDADGELREIIGLGLDITARKQADLALRESEERFRQLAENMSGFFWLYDLATRKVLYVGPSYEQLWGGSRESVYADPDAWLAPIHPDDRAEVMEGWRRQRRGECTEQVYRIVRADGTIRWVRSRGFSIRDATGSITRLAGIEEDVTEQRAAERELRIFKTVSDRAAYGSAIIDMKGKVTYSNEAFATLHGRTVPELLGQHVSVFHSAAQMPRVNELNERCARDGRFVGEEVWHVRADGSEFPTLMSGTIIRDEQGRAEFLSGTAIDITERKRAENALRGSREYLDRIINSIADPIFVKDHGHRFVLVNEAMCAYMGRRREEILGQLDEVFFPSEQVEVFLEKDRIVLETGLENINEEQITDARGRTHTVVTRKKRYTDETGRKLIVGIIRDITERKQAERLLKVQRDLAVALGAVHDLPTALETVLGAALQIEGIDCGGVYLVDEPTGAARLVAQVNLSPTFVSSVAHIARDSDPGRLFWSGQPVYWRTTESGDSRPLMEQEGLSAVAIIPVFHGQRAVASLNLGSRTLDEIPAHVRSALEGIAARIGSAVARLQAEAAIRNSEAKFRTLAETVPVAITITAGPRVLYVNSAAEAITGMSRRELLMLGSYWNVVHPDFRELVRDRGVARERGEPVTSRYEIKLLNRGSGERWVELSASYFEYEGAPATLATGIDITDRKRAEEEARRHQDELARVARVSLVGEMASGLAHELAQPLSAILYYARGSTARLEAGAWGVPDAVNTLDKIAAQAERAGEFIRRLKAFVRKAEPHRVPSDVNDVVREAVSFAMPEGRHSQIPIDLELSPHLPQAVVDAVQIEQVILNLIRNGIESMAQTPAGERRLVIQTCAGPGDTVCVSVRDAGCGLTPEVAAQVFDPFFTTKPGGTGLGLPISRSIIEAHDGELWQRPEPRRGTTFGFTLPIAKGTTHAKR